MVWCVATAAVRAALSTATCRHGYMPMYMGPGCLVEERFELCPRHNQPLLLKSNCCLMAEIIIASDTRPAIMACHQTTPCHICTTSNVGYVTTGLARGKTTVLCRHRCPTAGTSNCPSLPYLNLPLSCTSKEPDGFSPGAKGHTPPWLMQSTISVHKRCCSQHVTTKGASKHTLTATESVKAQAAPPRPQHGKLASSQSGKAD